jgi:hypothetical protein
VDITAPEAVLISEYFRYLLSPDEFAAGAKEIAEHAELTRGMSSDERWDQQTPCEFLDDESGECSIYEARPLACRFHHSLDASLCENAAKDPSGTAGIDKSPPIMMLQSLSQVAMLDAFEKAGLDDRGFELVSAVAVAMNEPSAAERWRKGERVFDAAVIPSDEADRATAKADMKRWGLIAPERLVLANRTSKDRNDKKRSRKAQKDARRKNRGRG